MKWKIFTKWNVYHLFKRFSHLFWSYRSRHPEMFSGKAVLKTSSKFTGANQTRGIFRIISKIQYVHEKGNTYIPWWFFFIKGQVWKLLQMLETHVFNNYFENLISTLPGREIMLFLVKRTKISNFRRYS